MGYNNASNADKMQFVRLDKLTKDYNLIQTVPGPTREDKRSRSSIDLIFTNDITIFNEVDIIKTVEVSDHHRIEIDTNYKFNRRKRDLGGGIENEMRMYNFFSEEINWDVVNELMEEKIWEDDTENKKATDITHELLKHINEICRETLPKRKKNISNNDRSMIPWERRRMFGRQKMLNRAKRKATTEEKKDYLHEEKQDVENEIVKHIE